MGLPNDPKWTYVKDWCQKEDSDFKRTVMYLQSNESTQYPESLVTPNPKLQQSQTNLIIDGGADLDTEEGGEDREAGHEEKDIGVTLGDPLTGTLVRTK